jgi:hypothetical protein
MHTTLSKCAAICCSLPVLTGCATPQSEPADREQAFIQDVRSRLPHEWRVELTGQSPQDWYLFAQGICDALKSGSSEAEVTNNVGEFFGRPVARPLIAAARVKLCPEAPLSPETVGTSHQSAMATTTTKTAKTTNSPPH